MTASKLQKIVYAAGFLLSGVGAAHAQAPDQMKMMYESARNQLGIMEYCADKGAGDVAAIDTQKKLLGMIPPPADTSGGDAAEKTGRSGKVAAMGIEKNFDEAAKAQGSTTEAYCQQLADVLKRAAAQMPK
jgi:hypothetical protein